MTNKQTEEKEYYYQKAPGKNGHMFWDTYLHSGCKLIDVSKTNPFVKETSILSDLEVL